MRHIVLLFKKYFIELFSAFKQKDKKDIWSVLSSMVLIGIVYGTFIYVFHHFARMYIETDFGDVLQRHDRLIELMTLGFSVIIGVNVIMGVKKIYNVITDGRDNDVLVYQPISTSVLYVYKLLNIYISQVVSTCFITLPIAIVVDGISSVGGLGFYLLIALIILLLPLISCAIASLLAIPFTYVAKKLVSKFWILLVIYVAFIGVGFLGYGYFLKILSGLVRTGEIKYVFDLQTIKSIGSITNKMYPGKFYTNILLKEDLLFSVLFIVGISLAAIAVSYYVVGNVYRIIIQKQLEGESKIYHNNAKLKQRNSSMSLLYKEFLTVLRTPTYAFQYFAMAITLPFMVYVCTSTLKTMIETLTIIDCTYALAIFVVSMFSILTNTFCTTNISRDGKMFALLKTLPISIHKIVGVKVLFCSIVSFASVLASSLTLLITGLLDFEYFLLTFAVGFAFSLVQIAYATRKDMKNPSLPRNDREEITEGNSNLSTLVLAGMVTTIVAGGGSLLMSIVLGMKYNERFAAFVSAGFVGSVALIALILSMIYLFKGIKEEYYISDN